MGSKLSCKVRKWGILQSGEQTFFRHNIEWLQFPKFPDASPPDQWGHMRESAAVMLPRLLLLALTAHGSACAPGLKVATAPLNARGASCRNLGLRGGQGQFSGCNPLAMKQVPPPDWTAPSHGGIQGDKKMCEDNAKRSHAACLCTVASHDCFIFFFFFTLVTGPRGP